MSDECGWLCDTSEQQPSPAPWRVKETDYDGIYILDANGNFVARVGEGGNCMANARLIVGSVNQADTLDDDACCVEERLDHERGIRGGLESHR